MGKSGEHFKFTVRRVRGVEWSLSEEASAYGSSDTPDGTCVILSANHPDPGDDVTACSQVATTSSCAQMAIFGARLIGEPFVAAS